MATVTHFSPAEDAILRAHPDLPHRAAAKLVSALGVYRTEFAIRARRKLLGLSRPRNDWPDADTERLRIYWIKEKLTASQIHKLWPERSRASINGKVNRMGWPHTAEQSSFASQRPPRPPKAARQFQHGNGCEIASAPKPPEPLPTTGPATESLNVPMWHEEYRDGRCKCPTSGEDAPEHLFCCAPVAPGLVYCAAHAAACFNGYGSVSPDPKHSHSAKAERNEEDGEPQPLDFERAA